MLRNAVNWPFLDEPIWRWAIFLVAIMLFMAAMSSVLRHM